MNEWPDGIQKAVAALQRELAATVEVEKVSDVPRYRLGVVSQRFDGMSPLDRQDLVWNVVDGALDRREAMLLSVILAYSPTELASSTGSRLS